MRENFKKYSNSLIGIIRCKFCVHCFSVQFCNKTNGGDTKHWKKDWFCSSLKKREKMLRSLSIERKIRMPHNAENNCVLLSQCWTYWKQISFAYYMPRPYWSCVMWLKFLHWQLNVPIGERWWTNNSQQIANQDVSSNHTDLDALSLLLHCRLSTIPSRYFLKILQ